jgi:FG-GAP-like repeat
MNTTRLVLALAVLLPFTASVAQEVPARAAALRAERLAQREQQARRLAAQAGGASQAALAPTAPVAKSLGALPFQRALPNTVIATGSAASGGVAAGDWNGDGLQDLATENNTGALLLLQQPGADFAQVPLGGSDAAAAMLVGDVSGDGLPDLVDLGGGIWSHVAKPDGTFKSAKSTLFGSNIAYALTGAMGDLNGDGLADIAFTEIYGFCECVHVGLALSNAKFFPITAVPTGLFAAGVQLADLNGDGHLDIATATASMTDDQLLVLPGLGDGSFAPALAQAMPGTLMPLDVALADFDLDGQLDAAVLQLDLASPTFVAVTTLLGHGDGSFTAHGVAPCSAHANGLEVADLDADGRPDLAVADEDSQTSGNGGGLDVLLGTGDGGFLPAAGYDLGGSTTNIAAADLDDDGDLDLGLGQQLQLKAGMEEFELVMTGLGIALNRGDGSFPSGLDAPLGAPACDVAAADLDGDGDADLVATRKGGPSLSGLAYALASHDAHGLQLAPPVSVPGPTNARHVAAADLDGDGRADLVLESDLSGGSLSILRNDSAAPGAPPSFTPWLPLGPAGLDDLQLADLDGDGSPDVLAQSGELTRVELVHAFAYVVNQSCTAAGPATTVAVADVDLDGWPDAVLALPGAGALQVLHNNTAGTLYPLAPLAQSFAPLAATVADFDDDGLPDIAALQAGSPAVRLLAGQGGGAFADAGSVALPLPGLRLVAVDLDRDHALDIVVQDTADAQLFLLRGHGDLGFDLAQRTLVAAAPESLHVADADGDLFPDVLVAGEGDGSAQVLLSQSAFFTDAGHALPASYGTPHLAADGQPFAGQPVSVTVTGLPPQAVGVLVLGLGAGMQPFHGGTLVPTPDASALVFAGQPLSDAWPDAPAGTAVWMQAWFASGGEAAASNALVAVTQ